MYDGFGLLLDGAWRPAEGGLAPVISPVTERPLGKAPVAAPADTEAAIESAARGFAAWSARSAFERADALHAIADEMIRRGDEGARMIATDLETALDVSVPTKFANAGQVCVTPDRFFVHESLHDRFVEGFAARAEALRLGDGLDAATRMGPLINGGRLAEIEGIVEDAVTAGARVVVGGGRARDLNAGFFHEPTVLADVTDGMKVFAEENFGPIAAITRFADDDEALSRANASEMGLSAYAFTRDAKRARRAAAELKAGMVGINSFALAASEAPFGGTRHSGMGREGGSEGISDYLDTKLAQIVL